VIGASFNVSRQLSSGTRVTCKLPAAGIPSKTHGTKN
jgi:hypothetical protein